MIRFYYGTVGSGKSMHLIAAYRNAVRLHKRDKEVILAKPVLDKRTEGIYTRFGGVEEKTFFPIDDTLDCIDMFNTDVLFSDIWFIDEAQFIPPFFLNEMLRYKNHEFNFYGLRNDVNKVMWPSVVKLMNYADEIIELPTTCELCKKEKASFNKSLKTIEDAQNSPGFHFIPVCGSCWAKD